MKLRDLLREQEEPERYRVAIVLDGGTIILTVPIPLTALQKDDIEERLRAYIERHKNSYNIPTTDFDVWYPVDEENNRIELPDVNVPDVEIVNPSDAGPTEPERNVATPGETETEPEIELPATATPGGISANIVTPEDQRDEELAIAYQRERFNTIDQDRDGVHDETGETLPQINTDGSLVNPETGEVVGAVAGTTYAEKLQDALDQGAQTSDNFVGIVGQGGGADGDTGDEGVEGTEGAVTGEQRAEIPSIIEELRAAMSGPGTSEGRMINALKRISSPAHLEAVVQMYREEYGDSLPKDMIDEFKYDLGGNNAAQVEEINRVMRPLGWEITGTRYINMRWQKYEDGGEEDNNETETDNGIVEDRPYILWNPEDNRWQYGVHVRWDGQDFAVSTKREGGFLGTSIGAKYMGGVPNSNGRINIEDRIPAVDDELIRQIDAYLATRPEMTEEFPQRQQGDVITSRIQAQLRMVGRDQGIVGEELTAEDAAAINQGPGDPE